MGSVSIVTIVILIIIIIAYIKFHIETWRPTTQAQSHSTQTQRSGLLYDDELIEKLMSNVKEVLSRWQFSAFSYVVETNISNAVKLVLREEHSAATQFFKQADPMQWALGQVYNETFKLLQNDRYYIMGSFNAEGEDIRNACLHSLHKAHDLGYISDADHKRECDKVNELVSSMLSDL